MRLIAALFFALCFPADAQVTAVGTILDDDSAAVSSDNFAYRCSGSGVVVCIDFDSGLTEDGGQYFDTGPNGTNGHQDTTEFAEGVGSLRFDLLAGNTGADIAGQWTDNSNPYLFGTGFGEGDTFYVQVMMRLSATMLSNLSEWDGSWKTLLIHRNTNSCAAMELTTINRDNYNDIGAYTNCGGRGMRTSTTGPDQKDTTPYLSQQAWDLSSASNDLEFNSANVEYPDVGVPFPTDEWFAVDYKVHIGNLYDSATGQPQDSSFEMWITGADGVTKKVIAVELAIENNTAGIDTETFNNITLTPYMTGLSTSSSSDAYMWFDSLIVSSLPIPKPNSNAVPSWVTNATDNTWTDVPGTDTGDLTASGITSPGAALTSWTGFSYDSDKQWIIAAAVGGHADRSQNDVMVLDVSDESPAWVQFVAPSGSAANTDAENGTGARGDGSRATDHNYNLPVYALGRVWLPGFGAMNGAGGSTSTAVWSWNDDDIANGELGYEYFGLATSACCSGGNANRLIESGADYDPVTRRVWQIKQAWANGTGEAIISVSAASGDITTYIPNTGNGNNIQSVVINPRKRTALFLGNDAYGDTPDMLRTNLDSSTGTMTTVTTSGCSTVLAISEKGYGTVFSQQSNSGHGAALIYTDGSQDFYTVNWPTGSEDGTGTYTCGTADMSGTAPSSISNGVWKKIGLITYPDGTEVIFVTDSVTGPVKFLKIPAAGL